MIKESKDSQRFTDYRLTRNLILLHIFYDKHTFITSIGLDASAPANPAMILDLKNNIESKK